MNGRLALTQEEDYYNVRILRLRGEQMGWKLTAKLSVDCIAHMFTFVL